jgi:hypothetical protein
VEGLKADLAESSRLMSEGKALLAGLPSPKSVPHKAEGEISAEQAVPPDVIGEWLIGLANRCPASSPTTPRRSIATPQTSRD